MLETKIANCKLVQGLNLHGLIYKQMHYHENRRIPLYINLSLVIHTYVLELYYNKIVNPYKSCEHAAINIDNSTIHLLLQFFLHTATDSWWLGCDSGPPCN